MRKVVQGDITTLEVDAIVNAANQVMLGGGGVDGAIHRASGRELYDACQKVPEVRPDVRCPTGEARITPPRGKAPTAMSQRGWMLRMAVFAAGIFLMSAGIALSIRSNLGTTPISTLPVAVNAWNLRISVGMATFLMNALFVVAQFCLLRSRFPARLWLQIPAVLFFGWTIDLCLATFGFVAPEAWSMRLIVNLTAIPVLAFGVWLCLVSDILLMPGDGLASAIGAVLHVDFAWAQVGTDTGIVITAALFGIATAGRVTGIREGTLLAMILVGVCVRLYRKLLEK